MLSFANKVVIVTGAGGGLGRSYALEFVRRGALCLVNDVGGNADKVVKECNDLGTTGRAVANKASVLEGDKIFQQAISDFGKVDIVVNNAGILRDKSFAKMSAEEWKSVLDVHLGGTFSLTHAVWNHMIERKFGRIINIGSGSGLYGNFGQSNYGAAKMGIVGLTKSLAKEGEKHNVFCNTVVPIAASNMTKDLLPSSVLELLDPVHVSPIVAYLAHETCKSNGEIYEVGGGWYSKVRFQRSAGVSIGSKEKPATVEAIASSFDDIGDFEGVPASYPQSNTDALKDMMAAAAGGLGGGNKSSSKKQSTESVAATNTSPNQVNSSIKFDSDNIFSYLTEKLSSDSSMASEVRSQINTKVQIDITKQGSTNSWLVDMVSSPPSITKLPPLSSPTEKRERQSALIICSDETFVQLSSGSLSPEFAYMRGLLSVKGNMPAALKIKSLLSMASTMKKA